jgi:hypothetical protein
MSETTFRSTDAFVASRCGRVGDRTRLAGELEETDEAVFVVSKPVVTVTPRRAAGTPALDL